MENNPTNNENTTTPSSNTGMAILCYLGILIVIPLLTAAKDDPFVKFHIKQGLTLIILFFVSSAIMIVPILGWVVGGIAWVVGVILAILGIINAVNGAQKELPIIGKYSKYFNF